ncbi:acyltransferase family protein [Solidesulfovibrio sp.]
MTRNSYLDNAKAILICLVVVGHAIELWPLSGGLNAVYLLIYTFHMPLFVFIAGYFSDASSFGPKRKAKLLFLLRVYVLSQLLYSLLYYILRNDAIFSWKTLVYPCWTLWFLLSLLCWNLVLPYAVRLRFVLPGSILLALAIGYSDQIGIAFSLSRTIAFFPCFLAGFLARRAAYTFPVSPWHRWLAVAVLIAVFWFVAAADIDRGWLYSNQGYARLGQPEWYAGVFRLGTMLLQGVASVAVLVLIPSGRLFYTALGAYTLPIYVLHPSLLILLRVLVEVLGVAGKAK